MARDKCLASGYHFSINKMSKHPGGPDVDNVMARAVTGMEE